jgi:hypothetical protein
LRTRLRFTGRALTLAGSLLVPVNFWFLVRSGLVRDQGRAWLVCALCALLYAHTAALLREKLYVYLASVATIATAWTLIYRTEPQAFGLYALSGKATAFLGPALIAAATAATGSQRLGVSPVILLFLLGLGLLYWVKTDDEQPEGHPA